MKTNSFIKQSMHIFFMGIIGLLILNSCSQEDCRDQLSNDNTQIKTRARTQWHWKCPSCHFLNGGWVSTCSYCGKTYSPEHGDLIYTILDCITEHVKLVTSIEGLGGDAGNIDRTIEIEPNVFPERVPKAWYEKEVPLKYYEELKDMTYFVEEEYADGVEFGWYRTVRVLYPGETQVERIGLEYDKWLIKAGKYLTDKRGRGIKAGTKAAIKAFKSGRS